MKAIWIWNGIVKRMAERMAGKGLDFSQDGDGRPFFYAVIRDSGLRRQAQGLLIAALAQDG